MNSPVFLNQNQKKFALPLSQPNSHPIKARVLTALPCVDHNNCGIAITEATTKKASQSRQRNQLSTARQAPTPITTMKLCACTSGKRPATTPAASIRRDEGKSNKSKVNREELQTVESALPLGLAASPDRFSRRSSFLPFTFLLFTSSSPCDALHHCVSTIAASGMPSRNPRCG